MLKLKFDAERQSTPAFNFAYENSLMKEPDLKNLTNTQDIAGL